MILDQVLTIAIGRDSAEGTLSDAQWVLFNTETRELVASYAQIVAAAEGAGVGSDDDRLNRAEETAVIVAINPHNVRQLRKGLAKLLKLYNQSSACFALDRNHRPAWSTNTGNRRMA